VTTPPSKGLVVELYLIYFGLAQSFVDVKDLKSLKRKQLKKLSGCDNASLTGTKPNVILHRSLRVRSLLGFIAIRRQNEVLYIINALENAPFF
jgi:hypothetical protein